MGKRAARPALSLAQRAILRRLLGAEHGVMYTANHLEMIALKRKGLVMFADGNIVKGRRMWKLTEKGDRVARS